MARPLSMILYRHEGSPDGQGLPFQVNVLPGEGECLAAAHACVADGPPSQIEFAVVKSCPSVEREESAGFRPGNPWLSILNFSGCWRLRGLRSGRIHGQVPVLNSS